VGIGGKNFRELLEEGLHGLPFRPWGLDNGVASRKDCRCAKQGKRGEGSGLEILPVTAYKRKMAGLSLAGGAKTKVAKEGKGRRNAIQREDKGLSENKRILWGRKGGG